MGVDVAVMRRAVFLDRDGVINQATVRDGRPYPPATLQDLVILPGVSGALEALRSAGFMLIVVTNQPDVARGIAHKDDVEAMHATLAKKLALDDFRTCYHDDVDGCTCRKPLPGLLFQAAHDHAIDLTASHMVGDRWRDVDAGRAAGCTTFFVDHGYLERRPDRADHVVDSLAQATDIILEESCKRLKT